MERKIVNKMIMAKVEELASKFGDSKAETLRQLIVAGIRKYPGEEEFMNPYPTKAEAVWF